MKPAKNNTAPPSATQSENAAISFDIAGGTIHVCARHATIQYRKDSPIKIPFQDMLSCSSKRRTLKITYNHSDTRFVVSLRLKSMPAAAAESAILTAARNSRK